jgi:cyclopropane fatty-acyl-phospholipid synthase-like methyltransferase
MQPITLSGFEDKFTGDADPWRTFSDRDEAHKRQAIVHGLGGTIAGRVLELAAGNGSNSIALARRALRLDATEGTQAGTALVARAVVGCARARASVLVLPAAFPRPRYDAIVVAEILYYLTPAEMRATARRVARATRPGGRLVLAHHRVDYPDFVQHAAGIHDRFLAASGTAWRVRPAARTGRWVVDLATRI